MRLGYDLACSLVPKPPVIVLEPISSDSLGTRLQILHMTTRSLAIWSVTRNLVSLVPDQIMLLLSALFSGLLSQLTQRKQH